MPTTRPPSAARAAATPSPAAGRRQEILAAALACFNEHGMEATTIEMVRARCGASVGSIYHHFGSKDGLAARLFFDAQDDQARGLSQCLEAAADAEAGIRVLVHHYVDWVAAQPELARFLYQARSYVTKGPHGAELVQRNRAHWKSLFGWFGAHAAQRCVRELAPELLPSLVIGPAESYCRAWLSARTTTSPMAFRDDLAEAAWRAIRR